jgi:single-stranded-DNA-specific exonuclease
LRDCGDLLARFGGHTQAAGFRLRAGAFARFREAFDAACAAQRSPDAAARAPLTLDGWLRGSDDLDAIWQALGRLEPFGEGHPRPRWGVRGARIVDDPSLMGSQGDHLRMTVLLGKRRVRAVGWKLGSWVEALRATREGCDLAVELAENHWNGERSIEFQLVDARPRS